MRFPGFMCMVMVNFINKGFHKMANLGFTCYKLTLVEIKLNAQYFFLYFIAYNH